MNTKKAVSVAALAIATTVNTASGAQPSFLEAAAFFLTGEEHLEKQAVNNGQAAVSVASKQFFFVMDNEPCTVIWIDMNPGTQQRSVKAIHVNFSKLPGPNSINWNRNGYLITGLVDGAICSSAVRKDASEPTGMSFPDKTCSGWFRNSPAGLGARQMHALQYIRDNFCMGLPQPQPRPY